MSLIRAQVPELKRDIDTAISTFKLDRRRWVRAIQGGMRDNVAGLDGRPGVDRSSGIHAPTDRQRGHTSINTTGIEHLNLEVPVLTGPQIDGRSPRTGRGPCSSRRCCGVDPSAWQRLADPNAQ